MKIMTFNIQHALYYPEKKIDLSRFARFIGEQAPDLCGLNEVRSTGTRADYADQAGILGKETGMYSYFGEAIRFKGTEPYGNALLSRYPFVKTETRLLPYFKNDVCDETRSVIKAEVNVDGNPLTVLVTHMGLTPTEEEHGALALCDMVSKIDTPVVVMGDFNATPDRPYLRPLLDLMQDTHALDPDANGFSFASYDPRIKIDYILYRGLKCTKCATVRQVVSDHFPVAAEFEF